MRVNGPGLPGAAATRRGSDRGAGEAVFATMVGAPAAREIGGSGAATALATLDAILALQGLPDPLARRRRAVRHGHAVLDRLDELRLGLIEGRLSPATLLRLAQELSGREPLPDDAVLEAVLQGIELRAAVELAKLGAAGLTA